MTPPAALAPSAAGSTEPLRRLPTQRRAEERIQRILDAADAMLAREGMLATRPLAVAAGVSVGSLYHWFPDKESIALALALRHWSELAGLVGEVAARTRAGEISDPVAAAFAALADGFRTRPGFLVLWFGELRTEELREATRPSRDRVAGSVARMLEATHPGADPARRETVARVLTLLGDGLIREAFRVRRDGDPLLLAEGQHALRAYVADRLGVGGDG